MTIDNVRPERHPFFTICTTAIAFCVLFISCAANSLTHDTKADAAYTDMIVYESEYDKAGREIVSAIISGDREFLSRTIDTTSLLDRALEGLPRNIHTAIERDMLHASMDQAGTTLAKNLADNSHLKFVRSRFKKGEHRALVRVDMNDSGLSYIDFILGKDEQGLVRIKDWHDYAQGQLYSETLRQTFVFLLPERTLPAGNVPRGIPADRQGIVTFSDLAALSQEGKYREWLNTYRGLPDELKYSRTVLVTRVLVASAAGANEEYLHALRDVSTHIGDDPSLSLLLVDYYLNIKDYGSAHRALKWLSEYTGGDAPIYLMHANVCLMEKDYRQSMDYARRAIEDDPSLEDAYWTLLAVSVYSQHYDIAVNTLSTLERRFGYAFKPREIAGMRGYESFAKSSDFADWKFGLRP